MSHHFPMRILAITAVRKQHRHSHGWSANWSANWWSAMYTISSLIELGSHGGHNTGAAAMIIIASCDDNAHASLRPVHCVCPVHRIDRIIRVLCPLPPAPHHPAIYYLSVRFRRPHLQRTHVIIRPAAVAAALPAGAASAMGFAVTLYV